MIGFISKGGVLVIPILFCSVLAFAIFCERFIRFAVLARRGRLVADQPITYGPGAHQRHGGSESGSGDTGNCIRARH